eukprot:CAMPEP_0178967518 /NCGR_PEP_ID=MMETSP0789-20121207/17649_1 /TAXON_ID=3005 /ORGANISM="Rhizosolenia setigera, Strain CCMP 1694" /LENGTH=238 /DNA_ID=CAMNT_0020653157 /DNA_START=1 /DNA_END=715 /DNA_ORIENTATION=-
MQENCAKACSNCCMDYSMLCAPYYIIDEIVATNDDDDYFEWEIRYKYPEQIDGYKVPERYNDHFLEYGIIDGFYGKFPSNYEKKFYGCASYSCFNLKVEEAYLKVYDKDKDVLIAQTTERWEKLRFCHYGPEPTTLQTAPLEAIFTISLEFSTSPSNYEDISKVVQKSVIKILYHAQIGDENIVTIILDDSCGTEFKICDIIIQVCKDIICGEGEEPDFLAFVGNTMKEVEANGQLLQ